MKSLLLSLETEHIHLCAMARMAVLANSESGGVRQVGDEQGSARRRQQAPRRSESRVAGDVGVGAAAGFGEPADSVSSRSRRFFVVLERRSPSCILQSQKTVEKLSLFSNYFRRVSEERGWRPRLNPSAGRWVSAFADTMVRPQRSRPRKPCTESPLAPSRERGNGTRDTTQPIAG